MNLMKTLTRFLLCILLLGIGPAFGQTPPVADRAQQAFDAGSAAEQRGDLTTQIQAFGDAATAFAATGNRLGQSTALLRRAEAYLSAGYYEAALTDFQAALALVRRGNDPARIAAVLASLGNAYVVIARFDEARQTLDEALQLARQHSITDTESVALNNLGNLYAAQQRHTDARLTYQQALKRVHAVNDALLQAKILVNAARNEQSLADSAQMQTLAQQAATMLEPLPASHDKTFLLLTLGLLWANNDTERAYRALEQARTDATTLPNPRTASYAYGYLARLYQQANRYQDALMLNNKAIFLAQQNEAPDILYLWHWQAGTIHQAQGNTDAAIAAYQRTLADLEPIRSDLLSGYRGQGSAFRDVLGPLFVNLADLLLRRAANQSHTAAQPDLRAAQAALEQLKTAELQDYFLDQCVTRAQSQATGLNVIAPGTAVLYPILLPDRLELLLSLADGIQQFSVPVAGATVAAEARTFRSLLEKRTTREYLTYSTKLYRWLLQPLEPALTGAAIQTLIIVPDGPLRTFPFGALHDGQHYLVEKYALATTPGLALTDATPPAHQRSRVLLSGLTESVQGFPPLPAVGYELTEIQHIFGQSNGTLLQDQNFILQNLESELTNRPYNVVHIASHGQFESDIRKSFLLTYNEKLNMDRLEEYMQLRRFSEQPVELLTLSACQTAAGDDRAALGLAGIAIKAGARSALGTLWFVNDEASSLLVADFYRHLQTGKTKAMALQEAQEQLLTDKRYKHPGYWSPFLLIGNWL